MSYPIQSPYSFFSDRDGSPLESGYLYFGVAGLPAETNPTTVYFDEALTIPASQPIRTKNGFPYNNGTPAIIWTAGDVSIAVKNSKTVTVFTSLNYATTYPQVAATSALVLAGLAVSSGSNLVGHIASGTGATATTVRDKLRQVVSVKDFGAIGNGVADDTAALQLAINSGAGELRWPAGTYMVGAAGLVGVSNQEWVGDGNGVSIVKLSATPTNNYLASWTSKSKFLVQDIAFDFNDKVSASSVVLSITSCDDFIVDNCRLLKMDKFGIAINAANRFTLNNNFIQKTTAVNTQNQAINISTFSGAVTFGKVTNNYMNNSAMNLSGISCLVTGNRIEGFKFGGGVTVEANPDCHSNVISNNVISGGVGTDVNSTVCEGIENWGKWSVISENLIYSNAGVGITNAGKQTVISNNTIFNNGVTVNSPAISSLSGTVSAVFYEGSECVISGNRCFDTSGAGGTQTYGYADNSSATSYNMLVGNNFKGNKTAPTNILGTIYSFSGPNVFGSVAFAGATITNGSTSTTDISLAGARMGDYVSLSYSLDLLGLNLYGYVSADNNVKVKFHNGTGGSVTIAAGTVKAVVNKPAGYADF